MKTVEEAQTDFKKNNNFRSIKKCCGNCKHSYWGEYAPLCKHTDLWCRDDLGHEGIAYFPIQADNIFDKCEVRDAD